MSENIELNISKLISVIIPTYNRSKLVVNAIDSVLTQTYKNFEIIVVDDCSTDDTIEVLSKYGDSIRLIKNESNSYVGFARNVGASFAKGDYIAFLDSDDYWVNNKLESQFNWMNQNNYDVSVTNFFSYNRELNIYVEKKRPYSDKLKIEDILYGVFVAPGSTLIIKTDLFKLINGYNITYRRLEDWDFLIRLFLASNSIGFFSSPTAQIFSSNNYTISNLKKSSNKLFLLNYKSLFKLKWNYPIILYVGILFELFVANYRLKNYFKSIFYFTLLNLISLLQHPYFKIHGLIFLKMFKKNN